MWGCVTTKPEGHGHVVAEVNSPPTGKGRLDPDRVEETNANGRLVAAAPDLLAALIDALNSVEHTEFCDAHEESEVSCQCGAKGRRVRARAAIAKAEGKL